MELRDTIDDEFDHVHLQQHDLSAASPVGHAEVMFFRPVRSIRDIERDMINDASKWITAAISGEP
jgi:hypothetical protein